MAKLALTRVQRNRMRASYTSSAIFAADPYQRRPYNQDPVQSADSSSALKNTYCLTAIVTAYIFAEKVILFL